MSPRTKHWTGFGVAAAILLAAHGCVAGPAGEEPARFLVRTWGMESGLPHSQVNALAQTDDGYLWVATPRGLARFDGQRFVVFGGTEHPWAQGGSVSALGSGSAGKLWIGTRDGSLIEHVGGNFHIVLPPGTPGLETGIRILTEDRDGRLWITSNRNQVGILRADGKLEMLSMQWQPACGTAFQARTSPDGKLIVNSETGLWEPDGDGLRSLRRFSSNHTAYHAPGVRGRYWFSDETRMLRWTAGTPETSVEVLAAPKWGVRSLIFGIEDSSGTLWLATAGHGLLGYLADGRVAEVGLKDGLGAKYVLSLLCDREGCVWAGTDSGGLSRITPAVFTRVDHSAGLVSDRVSAVCPTSDGGLLIGTKGDGVVRLREGKLERIGTEGTPWETADVAALTESDDGWLWIGTWNFGLLMLADGKLGQAGGFSNPGAPVTALLRDSDDSLWVGRSAAEPLFRVRNGDKRVDIVPLMAGALDIRALARADDGWLWVGTENHGLCRWKDGSTEEIGSPAAVPKVGIRSILAVGDTIWVATDGAGIWRWKEGSLQACMAKDGLPDDNLRGIQIDAHGAFWLSCVKGFFRIEQGNLDGWFEGSVKLLAPVKFGASDGLADLGGYGDSQACSAKGTAGELWFATNGGVVKVRPQIYRSSLVPPLVGMEEFLVDGVPLSDGARIDPGARRFEFRFTGIGTAHPEGLAFECRLDEVDPDWIPLGNQHSASYSTLTPGSHRFQVRVKNRDGHASERPATLAFTVLAPFWQRPAFLLFASLATLAAIVLVVRRITTAKLRRHLEQTRLERALDGERGRIARDMHDHLGAGLTELALLGDHLGHEQPDNDDVRTVSRRARDLIRAIDETVWVLNPRNDSLEGMVSYLTRSVAEWVKHSPVRCRFAVAPELEDTKLRSDVRNGLYLACKEAVHNVIKHAQADEVVVRISDRQGWCEIEISDNGKGFPAAEPMAGNGLKNMRERMLGLGGTIDYGASAAGGASVIFRVKLGDCIAASNTSES